MISFTENIKTTTVSWKSPSNIALVKYWGKKGNQIPRSPSLSITLKNSCTDFSVSLSPRKSKQSILNMQFIFEGKKNEKFESRIRTFLEKIAPSYFPFLFEYDVSLKSNNSFPHSAGIASSASSMSGLVLSLCTARNMVSGKNNNDKNFFKDASCIARLASGSACRSVFGGLVEWGETSELKDSSNEHAIKIETPVNSFINGIHDLILVTETSPKKLSSSSGHSLMNDHPFAEARYRQANENLKNILIAIQENNFQQFSEIVEEEALTLHSLIMSSRPGTILLNEKTLKLIEMIRHVKLEQKLPITFTIDAGPNVHVLYPSSVREEMLNNILPRLLPYCQNKYYIDDMIGDGPKINFIQ